MSQFSGIATNNAVNAGIQQASSTGNRFSEMTSEEFVKIIFTELTNQDPLQPNDTGALLEQLNSIRSIEADISLEQKLEALVLENQLASAGNLIGRFVGGLTDDAQRVAGRVVSVLRQDDEVTLELDGGWQVKVDQIEMIVDEDELAQQNPQQPATPA